MVVVSTMSSSAELNSFVDKFQYLCSAGFNASLTFNSNGAGHARVLFEVDLGFIQPPLTVPPPTSPSQKCRSPAYYRRLKKRRDLRQKTDPSNENNITQNENDAITVTEKVMKVDDETKEVNVSERADVSVVDDCRILEIIAENTGEVIYSTNMGSTNDIDVAYGTCAEEAESDLNPIVVVSADNSREQVEENAAGQTITQDNSKPLSDGRNDCDTDVLPFDHNLSAIENLRNLTMSLDLIGRRNFNTVSYN